MPDLTNQAEGPTMPLGDTVALTQLIERTAATTAELIARRLVDEQIQPLRKEVRELSDGVTKISQSLHGDNGSGLLAQFRSLKNTCETRPKECDSKILAVRELALHAEETAKTAAEPAAEQVSVWKQRLIGASMALSGAAGVVALFLELHSRLPK